jgi:phage terminase small subunit
MSKKQGKQYGLRKKGNSVANQWQATPQQELFLEYYLIPGSPTFANAYQSAIKAGYSESTAIKITAPSVLNQWIVEARRLVNMQPEHIVQGIQTEATTALHSRDRLKAYELLAKLKGMLVDRQITAHVNIEQALDDLK